MIQLANIKEVTSCLICGNQDLVPIIDLGEHAISSRFPKSFEPDPPLAPLQLVKCNDLNKDACGLLQLRHMVPGEEMYTTQYGYRSGLNATMTNHLNDLAKEIMSKIQFKQGDVILDIGSNDATLLKAFNIPVNKIGIDPTGDQFKQFYKEDIRLVTDYFSLDNFAKVSPNKKAKIITSIAMFYDLPNPMKFVHDIRQCLDENGIWISEQSYMPSMLKRNSFDTICHEHLEYYSLKQIDWMAKRLGLKILDVKFNEINGGSFRFYISHSNSSNSVNEKAIIDALNKEKELGLDTLRPFEEFKKRVEEIKSQLLVFLKEEKKKGKKIHIYGASTKGNTLLQYFGIGSEIIDAAAERNPEKFGRVTPKTRIPMISEEISRKEKPDYFLILPWHFKEEFISREKDYLESGGKFIFPLPEFQVIGKEEASSEKNNNNKRRKALVTGITGQIGSYLAELLVEKGYEVYGIVRRTSLVSARSRIDHVDGIKLLYADLGDSASIESVIQEVQPDEIYNLAAQSDAQISLHVPEYTLKINGSSMLRICDVASKLKKPVKVFQASSAELYGGIYNGPVNEETPFHPRNPYAIAKLAAHWIVKHYREQHNLFSCNGIVFNSESPRRGENFVTRKITKTVAEIKLGKKDFLEIGNLNAKRDWNHAKDTAYAIWLILQADKPDDYVIASGEAHSVREFVELAFKQVGIEISWRNTGINEEGYDKKTERIYVKVDPKYFRPNELNGNMSGDITKLRKLNWKPNYNLNTLIKEMIDRELKDKFYSSNE